MVKWTSRLRLCIALFLLLSLAASFTPQVAAENEPPPQTEAVIEEPVIETEPTEPETPADEPAESATIEPTIESTLEPSPESTAEPSVETTGDTPVQASPDAELPTIIEPTVEATVEALSASVVQAANGTFDLRAEDGNGDPVEGACFAVYEDAGAGALGDQIVDNICSVANGDALSRFQEPGDYIAVVTLTPGDFATPANVLFTVVDSETVDVPVVFIVAGGNAPGKVVIFRIVSGFFGTTELPGACFTVFEDDGGTAGSAVTGEICDDDDGSDDGTTTIDPLDPGDYILRETTPPDSATAAEDGPFTIVAGQTRTLFVSDEVRGNFGELDLRADKENTDPMPGACFDVFVDEGGGVLGQKVLDDECSISTGLAGRRSMAPEQYVVVTVLTPQGFRTPDNVLITIEPGKTLIVTVTFEPAEPDDPGNLNVTRIIDNTSDDFIVPGACFRLFEDDNGSRGDPVTDIVCDDDDGSEDGVTSIENVPPGTYILAETTTPPGEDPGADGPVTIKPGQTSFIFMGDSPVGQQGTLSLTAVDENSDGVEGLCIEVFTLLPDGGLGTSIVGGASLCSDEDGFILSRLQLPGEYIAFVVVTPEGFQTPADKEFTVLERRITDIPFVLLEADPNDPGSIFITKQAAITQELLEGSCFRIFEEAGDGERGDPISDLICDDDDGLDDGRILIDDVPPGTHVLAEITAPVGFVKAGDRLVTIAPGQRTLVTVQNLARFEGDTGFTLSAEDSDGDPLEGACFEIYEDLGGGALGELITGGTGLCSDEDGHVLSRNQEPGNYVARPVVTPNGFVTPANLRFTVVDAEIAIARVIFLTPDEVDDDDDNGAGNGDDDEDLEEVTALPNTGARSTMPAGNQEMLLLLLGGLTITVGGWSLRRRQI